MNRAHGGGVHVVVPGVVGGAQVIGHGAVGIGAVPIGSIAPATNFTAGNPITMNPFQHIPTVYHHQPFYSGYTITHTQPYLDFPPIPTYGSGNYYPYY